VASSCVDLTSTSIAASCEPARWLTPWRKSLLRNSLYACSDLRTSRRPVSSPPNRPQSRQRARPTDGLMVSRARCRPVCLRTGSICQQVEREHHMKIANLPKVMARIAAVLLSVMWVHGAGLDYLAAHANAVVVGTVAERIEGPSQVSFVINVSKVLSGTVSGPTANVVHSWTGVTRNTSETKQLLYGLWFLKRGVENGTWDGLTARPLFARTILSLFLPVSTTPPAGPYAYPTGTPLLDALAYEVAAGVQSANEDPAVLLGAFDSIDTLAVRTILETCLASSRPAYQAAGLAGILERSMPDATTQLAHLWPVVSTNPLATKVISALRNSWRNPSPEGVLALTSMVQASVVDSKRQRKPSVPAFSLVMK